MLNARKALIRRIAVELRASLGRSSANALIFDHLDAQNLTKLGRSSSDLFQMAHHLVQREIDERVYRFRTIGQPLDEAEDWIKCQRPFWESTLERLEGFFLERYVDTTDQGRTS